MAKITRHLSNQIEIKKFCKIRYLLKLCVAAVFLYAPGILNTNIEQEDRNTPRIYIPREVEFSEYFRRIDKSSIMGNSLRVPLLH